MTNRTGTRRLAILCAGAAMLAIAAPVAAQDTADSGENPEASDRQGQLSQIIVTARRVEEDLQTTPISISALTQEAIREQGLDTLSALDRVIPNLTYTTNGGGSLFAGMGSNPAIFIRGVGQNDFVIGSDPGVGTYVDGVFIARSFGGNLENLDIERIEVLRGPQGTLFGKNTEGGAISLTTTRPGDEFTGYFDAAYGSRNRVDVSGAATLPLSDAASVRIAAMSRTQDGYIHNDYLGTDVADTNVQAGRLSLRLRPTPELDILLSGEFLRQRQKGQQLSLLDVRLPVDGDVNDLGTRNTFYNRALAPLQGSEPMGPQWEADPRHTNAGTIYDDNADVFGTTLNVEYDAGLVSLRSITSYRDVSAEFGGDMDFSPANYWKNEVETSQDQFSQELQVSGVALEGALEFTGGLFYFHESASDNQVSGFLVDAITTLGLAPPRSVPAPGYDSLQCPNPDPATNAALCLGGNLQNAPDAVDAAIALQLGNPNISNRRQENNTYAAYGQVTYHVTDELELTGGLRYSDESKDAVYNDITLDAVTPTNPATTSVTGDQAAKIWTYTATIGYQPIPEVYLYATHSSGYKAGGIVSRVFQGQVRLPAYLPERNYNYEVGLKAELFDRVRINGALFRNWYDNIQFGYFRLVGGLLEAYIANPSDAELYGGELEVTALVSDRLSIDASLGVTELTYKNVQPEAPAPLLLGDARPENVPQAKVNVGFDYTQPLGGNAGDLSLRMDYAWQSSVVLIDYVQVSPSMRVRTLQDDYVIGTARLTYTPPSGDWEAYVHVDNMFDKLVETTRFNYNGITGALYNRPREIRAGVRLNF